ncbi:MAG: protein kinase [Alphaproteobacteria bacterium]|nr:protein kinase [Alphaproteobacteria bacterium]
MESRGARIGRYQIEAPIAEGATAIVYRAKDPAIGRTVAIKLLKVGPNVDEEFLARFQREAQAAGTISHPNIVTIYDVGRVNNRPYITMEYLPEKSLAELLSSHARLPPKRAIGIAIQLARALDHAHRHGIVHRDLKPENVLLVNGGETIKLTDFGVARLDSKHNVERTQTGTILGTPRYMSPEQAMGREVDGRSDLFSLGAILYQMLTGVQPFDSANLALLMLQIVQQDPAPISSLAPEVPEGLQRVVMKLLAKQPEQRFQTGHKTVEALQRELAAIAAHERDRRRSRFLPLPVKLAGLAGAALGVLFLSSMAVVYGVERNVLRGQAISSGAALARFVALHAAVPALGENWLPLRMFVEDGRARGFDYLVITDHRHVVQASTDPRLIGHRYRSPPSGNLLEQDTAMSVSSSSLPDGRSVLLFDTPITFQKTEVGRTYLGVDQAGMQRVLNATLWLMAILALVAIATTMALSRILGTFLLRSLRTLRASLDDFASGSLEVRISQKRKDEIGELFAAFNRMADQVQMQAALRRPVAPEAPPTPTLARTARSPDATLLAARQPR